MNIANVHEAKTNLSQLLAQVELGKEVIIAKAGRPVAKLVSYTEKVKPRTPGNLKGKLVIPPDFDAENKTINKMFYGK